MSIVRALMLPAILAALLASSTPAGAQPVIHEILASNLEGLQDEDGERADWIELHNPGPDPVSLDGWSLTDDAAVPGKWVFPDVTLAPGAYLIVFASDKDRAPTDGSNLHTNFKLTADGEYLGLYDAGEPRNVISEFAPGFPHQQPDIAWGRGPGGALLYLDPPTPGAANDTSDAYDGFLDAPTFSVGHGFFVDPFALELTHADALVEIRYTLDGAVPTSTTGQLYTAPLTVQAPVDRGVVIVRAAAFRDGFLASEAVTRSYIFIAGVLTQPNNPAGLPTQWGVAWPNIRGSDYGMDQFVVNDFFNRPYVVAGLTDVPTLSIVMPHASLWSTATGIYMNPGESGAAWERAASIELILSDGTTGFQQNGGIEVQGGSSVDNWKSAKLSFDLEFNGDFGPSVLSYPFFPGSSVDEFEVLTLDAHIDLTWVHQHVSHQVVAQYVRDAYTADLQLAMGGVSAHSRFCHLYLNGIYWGLYDVHEKPSEHFASQHFGGAPDDYDVLKHSGSDVVHGDNLAWNDMMAIVRGGLSGNAAYEQLAEVLDLTGFADYMLLNFYVGNLDWPHHNWYAIRAREAGQWRFVNWDAENGLQAVNTNWITSVHDVTDTPGEIFAALRANAEFNLLFADRAHRHFAPGGVLHVDPADPQYDPDHPERNRPAALYMERIAEIDYAIACESARWGDARRPNNAYKRNVEWMAELNRLLTAYFPQRSGIVLNQFRQAGLYPATAAPVYNQHGGEVAQGFAMTLGLPPGGVGTIYYTLDGSDPRDYGSGALSASAQEYTGPLVLTGSKLIKARTLNGASWSALAEAQFVVVLPPGDLVISEMMYSPNGGTDFEFIELHNATDHAIELSGLSIAGGVAYTFAQGTFVAAGGYAVIAGNPTSFTSRYPGVPVTGPWDGNLSNGGEALQLVDAGLSTIFEVEFDDEGFWPIGADGFGWSLVYANPGGDPNDGNNWRASTNVNGSPGAADPAPIHGGIVINEVLANSSVPLEDAIELHNPTEASINIGGWFLSDNRGSVTALKKFRIPNGTILPAGGFVVFYENQFNTGATSFGLSSAGEAVYLSSADGVGNLTGYCVELAFGATDDGVSIGRHVTSQGPQIALLSAHTFGVSNPATVAEFRTGSGSANAPPQISPVVINELMYAPLSGGDPFIELRNRTSAPVSLYNAQGARGWLLHGVSNLAGTGDYEFPAGAAVPAYGFALLVRTQPEAFRSQYSIPAEVPIYGPYGEVLDLDGERIRLEEAIGTAPGAVTWVAVDVVRFGVGGAWPDQPAGTGPSLERVLGNEYGDDPVNWAASKITGGTPGSCNTVSPHFGDADEDGDIDDDDLAAFETCYTGADNGLYPPECEVFDYDLDGDVDDNDETALLSFYVPLEPTPGDVDGDGVVSWSDYELLVGCLELSGPAVAAVGGLCLDGLDFDIDGDVDFQDFAVFQAHFGEERAYLPAACHAGR
jgi:hypothetical protein